MDIGKYAAIYNSIKLSFSHLLKQAHLQRTHPNSLNNQQAQNQIESAFYLVTGDSVMFSSG